jgi:hypothetical protein
MSVNGLNKRLNYDRFIGAGRLTHNFDDFGILSDFVELNVNVMRIMTHGDVTMWVEIAPEYTEATDWLIEYAAGSLEYWVDAQHRIICNYYEWQTTVHYYDYYIYTIMYSVIILCHLAVDTCVTLVSKTIS